MSFLPNQNPRWWSYFRFNHTLFLAAPSSTTTLNRLTSQSSRTEVHLLLPRCQRILILDPFFLSLSRWNGSLDRLVSGETVKISAKFPLLFRARSRVFFGSRKLEINTFSTKCLIYLNSKSSLSVAALQVSGVEVKNAPHVLIFFSSRPLRAASRRGRLLSPVWYLGVACLVRVLWSPRGKPGSSSFLEEIADGFFFRLVPFLISNLRLPRNRFKPEKNNGPSSRSDSHFLAAAKNQRLKKISTPRECIG